MHHSRFLFILSVIFFCFPWADSFAYDFEVDGVYYNIVSRRHHQVEVTHWEEETTKSCA